MRKKRTLEESIVASARHICERPNGAFAHIDDMIARISHPQPRIDIYFENMPLQTIEPFEGRVKPEPAYSKQLGRLAVNRLVMRSIYARYGVDPSRTITSSQFGMSMQQSVAFMGVRAPGYSGGPSEKDNVVIDAIQYGDQGIGFMEEFLYSQHDNPGLAVQETGDPFDPFKVTTGYSLDQSNRVLAIPKRFRFSAYEIRQGRLQGGRQEVSYY